MSKSIALSIHKFEDGINVNEDSARASDNLIVVSDGAGGGGLFAERWSRCLADHVPAQPITSADQLETWVHTFWEQYYLDSEAAAQKLGGIYLNKFYDEGSFATLVAVWRTSPSECRWMAFGDSVAFCYNRRTGELQHNFTRLVDFSRPPALINCKDELRKAGFRTGTFALDSDCVVFCCSDALSHYFLMRYEVEHKEVYAAELAEVADGPSRNAQYVRRALSSPAQRSFSAEFEEVFLPLCQSDNAESVFSACLKSLEDLGFLGHDDYSFAMLAPDRPPMVANPAIVGVSSSFAPKHSSVPTNFRKELFRQLRRVMRSLDGDAVVKKRFSLAAAHLTTLGN